MTPEQFTYDYLEKAFWDAKKKGNCSLIVDGVEVEKTVFPYKSNSGKTSSWEVTYRFKDSTGAIKTITKESRYKANRRNDEKRDFGLPG